MEASSSAGDSNSAGASKLLANLPSRGLLLSAVPSSNLGGIRVYVCDHDTSPPEDQVIKTDQTNILIRALTLKKHKDDNKASTSAEGSRKRTSERALDGKTPAKKPAPVSQRGAQQEGSYSRASDINYQALTVDRLRVLLRERGLSPKGKKEELIARLRNASK